jgi:putative membrane protein
VTSRLPSYPGSSHGSGDGPGPGPDSGWQPDSPDGMAGWHRLHPLSPLVRSGRHLTGLVVLLIVLAVANGRKSGGGDFISEGVVIAVVLVAGIISWAVTRWRTDGKVLYIETGLIRRQSLRFPLSKVQAIDVVQTGLARVFGLASIQLRMAGADSSDARLVALRRSDAQDLRQELLSLSQATAPAATAATASSAASSSASSAALSSATPAPLIPAGISATAATGTSAATSATGASAVTGAAAATEAPSATPVEVQADERVLFRVHPGRLVAGLLTSLTGLILAIIVAAIAVIAVFVHSAAGTATYLPFLIGAIIGVWRRFNGEYATTVALAPDGLRLRSGLVQTTAETIRPGRVQAVRLVEPFVWRWFGWSRLEVDVAGARQRRENQSEARRLRALVPVGSRAEAENMLGELVASAPEPTRRPPGGTRWKAPLNYHFLAWGSDDRYVVASRGRIRRTTTWVPLEKVQSVRWVQGPWQRGLGLASVKLDVAGKRVTACITDRTVAEARDILAQLPAQARAARVRASAIRPTSAGSAPAGPANPTNPAGPANPANPANPSGPTGPSGSVGPAPSEPVRR